MTLSCGYREVKHAHCVCVCLCAVFLDLLEGLDQSGARVVVIATSRCRQDLHPVLLQSRGCHVFEECLEIKPPDLVRLNGAQTGELN